MLDIGLQISVIIFMQAHTGVFGAISIIMIINVNCLISLLPSNVKIIMNFKIYACGSTIKNFKIMLAAFFITSL